MATKGFESFTKRFNNFSQKFSDICFWHFHLTKALFNIFSPFQQKQEIPITLSHSRYCNSLIGHFMIRFFTISITLFSFAFYASIAILKHISHQLQPSVKNVLLFINLSRDLSPRNPENSTTCNVYR